MGSNFNVTTHKGHYIHHVKGLLGFSSFVDLVMAAVARGEVEEGFPSSSVPL